MRLSKSLLGPVSALAVVVSGSGAYAQSGASQSVSADIDPQRLALARQVYTLMGGDAGKALSSMMKAMMANISAKSGADTARTEAMKAALGDSFDRMTPKLLDGAAQIMAQDFTAAQLHDMLAYYQSPTGQAMLRKMPDITRQSLQLGASLVPQMMRDFETDYCGRVTCTAEEQQAFAQLNARLSQTPPPPAPVAH